MWTQGSRPSRCSCDSPNTSLLDECHRFEPEPLLPTLISGDIALTFTPPKDGAGARAQVARKQPDGTWLRLLDQPEFVTPENR